MDGKGEFDRDSNSAKIEGAGFLEKERLEVEERKAGCFTDEWVPRVSK